MPPNRYAVLSPMELLAAVSSCRAQIELREGRLMLEACKMPVALIEAVMAKEHRIRAALTLKSQERPLSSLVAGSEE